MSQAATVPSNSQPYSNLPDACVKLFEAKARKGITFDEIAKAINKDELWVAAAFYAQAKFSKDELKTISELLDIPAEATISMLGDHWWPNRGSIGPMPPTDPAIYRLYEAIVVYGHPIKAVIHEKFGEDGIMSLIDCTLHVDKKPDPKGDRVVLTIDGKFLKYSKW